MAPERPAQPRHEGTEYETAPAQDRNVGTHGRGGRLVVAHGAQQQAGARFLEPHRHRDHGAGGQQGEVQVGRPGNSEQGTRPIGHRTPVHHDGVQHDQQGKGRDHRGRVGQAHQRIRQQRRHGGGDQGAGQHAQVGREFGGRQQRIQIRQGHAFHLDRNGQHRRRIGTYAHEPHVRKGENAGIPHERLQAQHQDQVDEQQGDNAFEHPDVQQIRGQGQRQQRQHQQERGDYGTPAQASRTHVRCPVAGPATRPCGRHNRMAMTMLKVKASRKASSCCGSR